MDVQLGAWLPDQIDYRNPGLEVCKNVIPGATGYQPARGAVSTGANVSGTIIGASSVYLEDASAVVLVATTTDLHVIRSGTVTASTLSLSLSATDTVAFQQFGAKVYATSKDGATWVLDDVETDNTFSAATGSPPSGRALAQVADFLVMGNLTDIDASDAPFRIRWSGFNDPDGSWATDIGRQSGFVDLDSSLGPVTAITGGTRGLVFQRQGVSRLEYTGGSTVFALNTFELSRGCVAPASAVQVGETTYYLAHDGFFATEGTSPRPISTGRIWDWFLENSNQTYLANTAGAVDFERRCIVWLFVLSSSQSRAFGGQLWFNWETGNWSYVESAAEWAVQSAKSGLTLEQVAAAYPDLDAMALSLDSPEFQASGRNLQVFSGGDLSGLTGATLEATWRSGDVQPFPGRRSYVSEITPLIETVGATVVLGTRNTFTAPVVDTSPVAVGSVGFAPFNHDGRLFQASLIIPAGTDWQDAYGFRIKARASGAT